MKTLTIISGNLFQIAASVLGDAMQWVNIARVNGLKDPMISTSTQIIIPLISSTFADGIGPQ